MKDAAAVFADLARGAFDIAAAAVKTIGLYIAAESVADLIIITAAIGAAAAGADLGLFAADPASAAMRGVGREIAACPITGLEPLGAVERAGAVKADLAWLARDAAAAAMHRVCVDIDAHSVAFDERLPLAFERIVEAADDGVSATRAHGEEREEKKNNEA